MAHAIAIAAILATVAGLAVLRARTAPRPAYDYPLWAWRVVLAVRAAVHRRHAHLAATRRNGTMLTRPATRSAPWPRT